VELFAAIRRDARVEECSIRELADRYHTHRRTVRQALASAIPPPRKGYPPRRRPAIDPYVGEHLQFKVLAVVLFGGLGSIPGAVLGGVLLGFVEAMAAGYLATSYRDLFAFMTMVVILFFRPSGLFGRRLVERV